ncbi:uncharacterized protein [Oryza sativa Japonica Group]|uniref:uncharacterized protein isoform X1 n=1 Tax=Oryza sativa subsp. japonica TaxID=39947 RepID=UPI00339BC3C6
MDCVVLGWLYGSISATLMQEVISPTTTTRSVWRDLELHFLDNGERRAVNLTAEVHHLQQGDLSIGDYCRRLKVLTDNLADVGESIKDRSLVLMLIGSLNDKFDNLRSLLPLQVPFPTFAKAHAQLLLDELTKGHRPAGTAMALLAASSTNAHPATSSNTSNSNSRNNNHRRSRGNGGGGSGGGGGSTGTSGGGGNGSSSAQGNAGAQAAPRANQGWPTAFNPWTGSIHM